METSPSRGGQRMPVTMLNTIAALFEEAVDAEHALVALRKADQSADRVSLLVRSQQDEPPAAAGDVARDIVAAALGVVGQWLTGLAELIVSDRERYLVAGPMGAALTGMQGRQANASGAGESSGVVAADLNADWLQWVLKEFGFTGKEAAYIEHRLTAGATLIAMTTADETDLERAEALFGDHGAVYIEHAETRSEVVAVTAALLTAPAAVTTRGAVSVADAVARIRPVASADARPDLEAMSGRAVHGERDEEAGKVLLVLVEIIGPVDGAAAEQPAPPVEPRYVVVGFGGVLGIRRRQVAVPAQLVDFATNPARILLEKDVLARAPAYDDDAPLGRREEERIFHYFDVAPYWAADEPPAPAAMGDEQDVSTR